ncbi:MAG: deaminase, partial [Chloroflexota bacterium]|nr:deaminase [Chloroflexota bacterium]
MRKLIVNNFVTMDGYYEAKNKTIDGLFEYYHEDYAGDQNFDYYSAERLRAADTLVLSGRTSFLGNKGYWTGVPNDPKATLIRRELAELFKRIDKVVISDKITHAELAAWDNTRIVKVADAHKE